MAQMISDTIDLTDYLEDKHDGENIRPASTWRESVKAFFHGGKRNEGAVMPWTKTHEDVQFRNGEVSLWHGMNGHGKSMVTSQVGLDLAWQNRKVCIASMEMQPPKTMARMSRQASGCHQPSEKDIDTFHDWSDGKIWIYDRHGQVNADRIAAVIRYSVDKLGIEHFFVDSLMKCVKGEDDYNGQKDFVNQLCTIAQSLDIHIHLIHHTKKPQHGEETVPGKYDAKGSGSIVDQVDNVFSVWRNKRKEAERKGDGTDERIPDCLVTCDKQRNGEWEGKIGLWFDPASFQYRGNQFEVHKRVYSPQREAA